jgi:uncharacterized membrane protein required for colicin V production
MSVDLIILAAVLIGFLWGYQRGILKTLVGFLSVAVGIVVFVLLFRFGGRELFTSFDLSEMEQLAVMLSLSMVSGWLITSLIGSLLNTIADKTMLGVPNRLIGGLFFSVLFLFVSVLLVLLLSVTGVLSMDTMQDSMIYTFIRDAFTDWMSKRPTAHTFYPYSFERRGMADSKLIAELSQF